MTTCTTSIHSLLIPALEAVGADERAKDRYAMAAAIGFLTLWERDLVQGRELPIPADQLPPDANTAEMIALTTWWELLDPASAGADHALYREVLGELRVALADMSAEASDA